MSILGETRFIERLQFFNGQRLFASDLQGLEEFNREMRWLHNKSLHQPGIGNGYAVTGNKGDREVTIGPGYAIDVLGREIVLGQAQIEPVPPVAGESDGSPVSYDLTVSYPPDTDLEEAETRDGICLPRGVVRLREEPGFCWVRLERDGQGNLHPKNAQLQNDIKDGLKILLARIDVLNCQLNGSVSLAERRSARPATQPYIACGEARPTLWSDWVMEGETIGLKARIDTGSAAFKMAPCYRVRIDGPRITKVSAATFSPPPPADPSVAVADLIHIEDVRADSFTAYVLVFSFQAQTMGVAPAGVARTAKSATAQVLEFAKKNWALVWMGVEG